MDCAAADLLLTFVVKYLPLVSHVGLVCLGSVVCIVQSVFAVNVVWLILAGGDAFLFVMVEVVN